MATKDDNGNVKQEELRITPPLDDVGEDARMAMEDKEAMDAIRKYTDEDADDMGEISVKSILGGDFLMSRFMLKQVVFFMFLVVLMLLYTGNRYSSQQDAILIDSLREHLQEVKYNVLTQSSELMNMTRQSNIELRLKESGDSLLHNSITPPFLIKASSASAMAEEENIEEVLVDSANLTEGTNGMGDEEGAANEEEQSPVAKEPVNTEEKNESEEGEKAKQSEG